MVMGFITVKGTLAALQIFKNASTVAMLNSVGGMYLHCA